MRTSVLLFTAAVGLALIFSNAPSSRGHGENWSQSKCQR